MSEDEGLSGVNVAQSHSVDTQNCLEWIIRSTQEKHRNEHFLDLPLRDRFDGLRSRHEYCAIRHDHGVDCLRIDDEARTDNVYEVLE
jgi:hypothetical protein